MSVFTPEEYEAHLTVATGGLNVARLEVLMDEQQERVHALVAEVVPLDLLAWNTVSQLENVLAKQWPYLHASASALPERLELAGKEISLAAILHRPVSSTEIEQIFQIDDEGVRVRLMDLRRNLARLFE